MVTVESSSVTRKKSQAAFRTIGEVAAELGLPQHVLRFWETKFSRIRPHKRRGGHRYYRPVDVGLLKEIKGLLYDKGFTIKGAQKYLEENREDVAPSQQRALFEKESSLPSGNIDGNSISKLRNVKSELDELKRILNTELTDA